VVAVVNEENTDCTWILLMSVISKQGCVLVFSLFVHVC
jgi:hypothetical protein